jgi:hypothetical protein
MGAVIMLDFKSLSPFIQESLMQTKDDTAPMTVNFFLLLKPGTSRTQSFNILPA